MSNPPNPLNNYRILVADADQHLSLVLKLMLGRMGFGNVQLTRSGQDALKLVQETRFDFLITEWNIKHLDGIEMINRIRRDPGSPNPALPIIMLTGRAEQSDITVARDSGINEYVIKPFTAHTVYARLERIVEHPRNFVVSDSFVGPCRRHKGTPPPGVDDRRTARLAPQILTPAAKTFRPEAKPKLWLPDYTLKQKLGENVTLPSLITPAVLDQAQASIDAITDNSLQWIKENMTELATLVQEVGKAFNPTPVVAEMSEVTLTIRARAGTFGYNDASNVAYMLYLFCRDKFQPHNGTHMTIVHKHIEVLQVILSSHVRGSKSGAGKEIVAALQILVKKYAP